MGNNLVLFGISTSGSSPETLRAFSVTHSPGAPQTGLELDSQTVSEHVIANDLLHPRRQPVHFQVTRSAEVNLIRSQVHRIP
jgi:fructoselysine-6-P-deglycase FrlB-like protein